MNALVEIKVDDDDRSLPVFDASRYRDEYAVCRDEGHQWSHGKTYPTPNSVNTKLKLEVTRHRVCQHCGTSKDERFILYPQSGRITRLSPHYSYDDDYRVTGIAPWEVAQQCRLTNLLNNLED